jgi:hypothetical protein
VDRVQGSECRLGECAGPCEQGGVEREQHDGVERLSGAGERELERQAGVVGRGAPDGAGDFRQ